MDRLAEAQRQAELRAAAERDRKRMAAIVGDRQEPLQRRVDACCALQNPRFPESTRLAAAEAEDKLRAAAARMRVSV